MTRSDSAVVAERLDHPVIDGDGHWLEPMPIFLDFLEEEAGSDVVKRFLQSKHTDRQSWYELTPEERIAHRSPRKSWWGFPGNTLDRATAMLPALMNERLADFGIDYAIVYPTLGLTMGNIEDAEVRRASCRAINRLNSEFWAPYSDRATPAAIIPVHTPEEAIEEVEYAVGELNSKVIVQYMTVQRRVDANPNREYVDTLGLDSPYDYEPYWLKCQELGVSPTDHGGSWNWPDRQSPTNWVYNRIGHFGAAQHAGARALFLGGVARRHPGLRFAFLEGGVGWAVNLLSDLVSHFEKRSTTGLATNLRPLNIDVGELESLFMKHAPERFVARYGEILNSLDPAHPFHSLEELTNRETECVDDFGASGVTNAEDLKELFRTSFYFGCEADDPMTALAFDDRFGAMLKPFFSSDVGHFDVTDMSEVLHEAWELVEDGLITEENFKEFTFSNIATLHTACNPGFFAGTVVEREVDELLRA